MISHERSRVRRRLVGGAAIHSSRPSWHGRGVGRWPPAALPTVPPGLPVQRVRPAPRAGPPTACAAGAIRAGILLALLERPMHGYEVMTWLGERSGGMWRPSPGSVYPTLQQLEDADIVRAAEVEGKRVFSLTDAGRATAEKLAKRVAPWDAVDDPMGDEVRLLHEAGWHLSAAVQQVAVAGDDEQIAARTRRARRRAQARVPAARRGRRVRRGRSPRGRSRGLELVAREQLDRVLHAHHPEVATPPRDAVVHRVPEQLLCAPRQRRRDRRRRRQDVVLLGPQPPEAVARGARRGAARRSCSTRPRGSCRRGRRPPSLPASPRTRSAPATAAPSHTARPAAASGRPTGGCRGRHASRRSHG